MLSLAVLLSLARPYRCVLSRLYGAAKIGRSFVQLGQGRPITSRGQIWYVRLVFRMGQIIHFKKAVLLPKSNTDTHHFFELRYYLGKYNVKT